jgi:PhzF family phenazine biosynthesis protein
MEAAMKYYVVDAFTEKLFCGNPAGVCLLDQRIDDDTMQKIAFENNLAETAFVLKADGIYELRWFTPEVEIDLCGHATLGSAHILMNHMDTSMKRVDFMTKSGKLSVTREGEYYSMDFPSRKPVPCDMPELLERALGVKVLETHLSRDLLVVIEGEDILLHMKPDFQLLKQINQVFGFIVTAKGTSCDFVSRFFAPNAGIMEDPVTGSSHSTLIPFWSERLSKKELTAKQLSSRGGSLLCRDQGERVEICGKAVTYQIGEINI